MAQMRKQSQPTVYSPLPTTLSQHQTFLDNLAQLEWSPGYQGDRDHWEEGADSSLGHLPVNMAWGQDTLVPRKLLPRFANQLVFSKGSRLLPGEERVCKWGRGLERGLRVPRDMCPVP